MPLRLLIFCLQEVFVYFNKLVNQFNRSNDKPIRVFGNFEKPSSKTLNSVTFGKTGLVSSSRGIAAIFHLSYKLALLKIDDGSISQVLYTRNTKTFLMMDIVLENKNCSRLERILIFLGDGKNSLAHLRY